MKNKAVHSPLPELHICRYLNDLLVEQKTLLSTMSPCTFLENYARLRMIEEKLVALNFGLTYPEIFEAPFSVTLINYCEEEYLRFFYDQRDVGLLNKQRSLFYTVWPDIPPKIIWETKWSDVLTDTSQELPLLKQYYQLLQHCGRELASQLSSASFQQLLPEILAIDAKCNLLFWFLAHSSSEPLERAEEIVRIVEHDYKKAQEELLCPLSDTSKMKLLYTQLV